MSTYKITKVEKRDDTIVTYVTFDFDGKSFDSIITHFQPQSLDDIILGINNRAASDGRKVQASEVVDQIIPQIAINKTIEIVG